MSIQVRLKECYLWPKTASEAISECNFQKFSWWECAPVPLADVCYARTECAYAVST